MPHPVPDPDSLFTLFHRGSHLVFHQLHRHGSHAQGRILGLLAEHGPLSQKILLQGLHVRPASLSELLGKLEKSGAITREKDRHDKRSVVVSLTEQGRRAAAESMRELENGMCGLFAPLDEAEQNCLRTLLTKLVRAWESELGREGAGLAHGYGEGRRHVFGQKKEGEEKGEETGYGTGN